jgi:uncharacterized protein YjbI with pentapeptide repeats
MGSFGPDQVVRKHYELLLSGPDVWNAWRAENPNVIPGLADFTFSRINLSGANLRRCYLFSAKFENCNLDECDFSGANLQAATIKDSSLRNTNFTSCNLVVAKLNSLDLRQANLRAAKLDRAKLQKSNLEASSLREVSFVGANLTDACLSRANLRKCDLRKSDLSRSDLSGADLTEATLSNASLKETIMTGCHLAYANLNRADLTGALLERASLAFSTLVDSNFSNARMAESYLKGAICVRTNLSAADLTGARVHGASIWDVTTTDAIQNDLVITDESASTITVDDIEIAQFIYLLMRHEKIRNVINAITSRAVLILGRFSPARKAILDDIRRELRRLGFLPILFDSERPDHRDLTETIITLASISKFVIADLTDAKSIPQELSVIVPQFPSIPVQPIILEGHREYSMFEHFARYPWVRKPIVYTGGGFGLQEIISEIESIVQVSSPWQSNRQKETMPGSLLSESRSVADAAPNMKQELPSITPPKATLIGKVRKWLND